MGGDGELAAGVFSAWLAEMRAALGDDHPADVPCGSCTACCRSSQFVTIGPDEADTLAHIPAALLFPAPRTAPGHVLLGYDERGHCPMLAGGGCSIYEHRPRTCRTYDCRIFPATGLAVDEGDPAKADIARQARRWRFTFPADDDRRCHDAVRVAAVAHNRAEAEARPANITQVAVRAIETYEEFL